MARRRIAVIGSGVAGLTAAHVLQRGADVTLYEADPRLGGHADTHEVAVRPTDAVVPIDTGFIVHNHRTYPTLLRLFAELGVATQESRHEHVDLLRRVRAASTPAAAVCPGCCPSLRHSHQRRATCAC